MPTMDHLIPMPVSVSPAGGVFALEPAARIYVQPAGDELLAIGRYLAARLAPATGYDLQVSAAAGTPPAGSITLTTAGADPALGDEGYELAITPGAVTLVAPHPAGLFYGVQTLLQLLPPEIEGTAVRPGPWLLPAGTIRDHPRFAWRGAMLDVARHFFGVGRSSASSTCWPATR